MHARTAIILLAIAPVLATAGCATKKFVREEIGKTEAKLGSEVGRVEGALSEERTRVAALSNQLGETRTAVEDVGRKAGDALGLAQSAQGRAENAEAKAVQAQTRADEAHATATQALARADETSARLTRLWSNRHKWVPADTIAVLFRFDRADLDDRAQTALIEVARQLQENPNLVVELEGYTDSTGAAPYNVQLSQRRADAVRRYLVEKGVELHRIHWIGLGDIRPTGSNDSPKGREQNRRVMVRLFAPAE